MYHTDRSYRQTANRHQTRQSEGGTGLLSARLMRDTPDPRSKLVSVVRPNSATMPPSFHWVM